MGLVDSTTLDSLWKNILKSRRSLTRAGRFGKQQSLIQILRKQIFEPEVVVREEDIEEALEGLE